MHPRPREYEGLEVWVRRIARDYGIGYDTFLWHALGRTGAGARYLEGITDTELDRLAAGTGVPVERLRAMMSGPSIARVVTTLQSWSLTKEGRYALEQIRVTAERMTSRT